MTVNDGTTIMFDQAFWSDMGWEEIAFGTEIDFRLTISALKALFTGRRELFKGLYIDGTDWKWETYPVIHFEFNDLATTSIERFESNL